MLKRTEGIVLRTISFGEADLIVTYLTHDFGILKLFAKSPRKIKSRFGSSLEPLTHSRISFWGKEDASLPRLTQSDIISSFQSIRDYLYSFIKTSEIIELTIHFAAERDTNRMVYFLLLNTLRDIENNLFTKPTSSPFTKDGNNRDENLIIIHYKVKFLKFMGYTPRLDACGRCGKSGNYFYISEGSILCGACANGIDSPIRVSPTVIKFYNDLLLWDPKKINRIKPSENLLSEVSGIINIHIKYILSRPLKSESFIYSMR
ncbi:MAG: DNA repair protein RecO [Nitrospirota bacterium]